MTQTSTPQPSTLPPLDYAAPGGAVSGRIAIMRWINLFGTFIALVAIYGFFCILTPRTFLTVGTIEAILRQTTIVGIASMGMTLIVILGGIDLSAGSIVAFTCVVVAAIVAGGRYDIDLVLFHLRFSLPNLTDKFPAFWPLVAFIGGALAGAACGLVNGALITGLRVVPFIITLGTLLIFRSLGKDLGHEQKIDAPLTWINDLLSALSRSQKWMIFPLGVWIMIVLLVLTILTLHFTRFGRHMVAIGSNEQTARLCGIPVRRVKILVYMLGGMAAGIAGVMQFSRLTVGDPTVAVGLELDVIAAVVIGGGSLSGGEGSPLGALVGAMIMTTIRVGSSHLGWPNPFQEKVTGIIIILAVALDSLRQRKAAAAG